MIHEELRETLNESSKFSINSEKSCLNYFSVAGFSHYEVVASNISAFFFNYNECHNLKDLWLKSLIDCYNLKANTNYAIKPLGDIYVEREAAAKNDRIDILIQCEKFVIVVENKLFSGVNNPFESYHETAVKLAKENEYSDIIEILLTLRKESNQTKGKSNFINITYNDLFEKISSNQSFDFFKDKTKWSFFMEDFIENIKKLQGDNMMNINKDWQTFLQDNQENIFTFLENFNNDIEAKKENLKNAMFSLKERLNLSDEDIGIYGFQKNKYFSIYLNRKDLALEIYSMAKPDSDKHRFDKFYVEIWNRNNKTWKLSSIFKNLKSELSTHNFSFEITTDGDWGDVLLIDNDKTNWSDFNAETFVKNIENIYKIIQASC